jgi:hypothetical protein
MCKVRALCVYALDTVFQRDIACSPPRHFAADECRYTVGVSVAYRSSKVREDGSANAFRTSLYVEGYPVRVLRPEGVLLPAVAALIALLHLGGCAPAGVGDPCLPEQIPEGGFDDSEAYIESSSVQCQTRVCMVWHMKGAPQGTTTCTRDPTSCAPQDKVDQRVYCTCRCDAGNTRFASCTCPSGYTCNPVLEQGSEGVRGSYCVLSVTANASMN